MVSAGGAPTYENTRSRGHESLEMQYFSHGDSALFIMYRMYGMPQGAREDGAAYAEMYGRPQGAREGGAAYVYDRLFCKASAM